MNTRLTNLAKNKNFKCYIAATLATWFVDGIKYVVFAWLAIRINPNVMSVAIVIMGEKK